jgi:hypothetical protein
VICELAFCATGLNADCLEEEGVVVSALAQPARAVAVARDSAIAAARSGE